MLRPYALDSNQHRHLCVGVFDWHQPAQSYLPTHQQWRCVAVLRCPGPATRHQLQVTHPLARPPAAGLDWHQGEEMSVKPQLIVKGRKFDQVLEGARTVFMRDGFERASVDDIAREAGVSKATLYAYFPDKRLLFMEIASAECRRQADEDQLSQWHPGATVSQRQPGGISRLQLHRRLR